MVLFVDEFGNLAQDGDMKWTGFDASGLYVRGSTYTPGITVGAKAGTGALGQIHFAKDNYAGGVDGQVAILGGGGGSFVLQHPGDFLAYWYPNESEIRWNVVDANTGFTFRVKTGAADVGYVARLASGQSADAFQVRDSADALLCALGAQGEVRPAEIADVDAPNNSIYFSLGNLKLVYKDAAGSVNDLY